MPRLPLLLLLLLQLGDVYDEFIVVSPPGVVPETTMAVADYVQVTFGYK